MKNKTSKRALLLSALSLLLCFSMLIGTTYAWFTDSVTSTGNIIKSGKLDVAMYWAKGTEAVNTAIWNDASQGAIFDYDKWEPGYAEVRHIKIANEGTLALKYQLNIIANGTVSELADVIDVYYADPAVQVTDRAALDSATKLGTLTEVMAGFEASAAGNLEAGEAHTVTLALKMQETAGNEYQDLSIGSDFSVQLLATQLTSEFDSFDNQYDVKATYLNQDADGAWLINNIDELYYFASRVNGGNSYNGETVKLEADIDLAGYAWIPMGDWNNTFNGTFDGQGHTISNLYINDPAGEGVGLFGVTQKATIKGVTLKNVDVTGYSMVAALVGAPYPSTISDCHVTGNVDLTAEWAYVAGIAGYCYYGTQVDNCSVVADGTGSIVSETRNAVGGITAWLLEGNHKVTNCVVKNLNLTGWTNIGGITGFVHYNNTIEGCTVENVKLTKTRVDGNPGIGLIAGGWSYSATNAITLRNNSVKNATLEGNHIAYAAYNVLYGSEYGGATTANFVLDGNTTDSIENKLVEIQLVKTGDALKQALTAAQDGDVIVLGSDVEADLTNVLKANTEVTIDGNGKELDGIITVDGKSATLLSAGLTIKNVKFVADSVSADACIRLGDGTNATRYTCNVTVENCVFDVPGAVGIKSYTGGDKNLTVKNCVATERCHSLIQAKGIDGILIEDCKVYSKNGLNFNNSTNVIVRGCTVDVKGYAVRFGESSGGSGAAEVYRIENCSLKSANDDGDAVIILRGTADNSTLTIVNTTLEGDPKIKNTASGATVIQ